LNPINYSLNNQNPFDSVLKGVEAGLNITAATDQREAKRLELEQKKAQFEQQQAMQQEMNALATKENITAKDIASMTIKYPALTEGYLKTWGTLDESQQKARLTQGTEIYSALNAGRVDIAERNIDDQITALKEAGKEEDAKPLEILKEVIKTRPEAAMASIGIMLSSTMGADKFANTFSSLQKLPAEVSKATAEARQKGYEANYTPERLALENQYKRTEMRNIDSQIQDRAAKQGLEQDKLQSGVELKLYELNQKRDEAGGTLTPDARKLLNDSAIKSVGDKENANQMFDLANRLEQAGGGYGKFTSAKEWLKDATGNQDAISNLRKEYLKFKNSEAIKLLPPGPATDKDLSIALSSFISENADAKAMATFLKGLAKMAEQNSVYEEAKAEWVNGVGHLGKATKDIEVDNINVGAGTSFPKFFTQYTDIKKKQKVQDQLKSRSYMKYAEGQ